MERKASQKKEFEKKYPDHSVHSILQLHCLGWMVMHYSDGWNSEEDKNAGEDSRNDISWGKQARLLRVDATRRAG